MIRTSIRLVLFLGLLTTACAHHRHLSVADVQGPFTWGGVDNVTHLSRLWFSAQPDAAALDAAKRAGVSVVINLRDPSEFDWDEEDEVEARGMTYYNVPVRGGQPLSRTAFERVEALVQEHPGEQVWIHCSSSNRAGAWLATHMVEGHGMSVEEGIEVGHHTGLTNPGLERSVRTYLGAP